MTILNPVPKARPAEHSKTFSWNPLGAVIYVLAVYFASQVIGGIILSIYPSIKHWSNAQALAWQQTSIAAQFIYFVVVEGLMVLAVWLFLRRYRAGFRDIGLTRPKASDPLYGVGGFAVYYACYVPIVIFLARLIPALNVNQEQQIGFNHATGLIPLIMVFLSLVILPPLVEEILMRGFLFGSLRTRLSFAYAAIITSVVFASGHLQLGSGAPPLWVAAIDTFVLSLVLCYLREKTGRLWASITVHMLKNGIAFVSLFLAHPH